MGADTQFWVSRPGGHVLVDGVVRAVSDNAWWVFDERAEVAQPDLDAAIEEFESSVWPTVTGLFGGIRSPGIDGDPRLVIFHARLSPGVAGYFSSTDAYSADVLPFSNERESVYLSTGLRVGTRSYMSVLTHELQHAVHWAADPGRGELAERGFVGVGNGCYRPLVEQDCRLPADPGDVIDAVAERAGDPFAGVRRGQPFRGLPGRALRWRPPDHGVGEGTGGRAGVG